MLFLRRKTRWREEWMRDRALLRDLLQKTSQASPRELAQATGRSMSWVKKWRKRITEGEPQDQEVLCSRSRAHHAPSFRWDMRVTQRIVEMRLAPPEHLKRVPAGPRALLYSLPRDPELQGAQPPLPRSSPTIWKILHATGCLMTRSKERPHPNNLRAPLEESQMDAQGYRQRLAGAEPGISKRKPGDRSLPCALTQAPRSPRWPKTERISTNKRQGRR